MQFHYQMHVTLEALRRWLIAQCVDSLLVSGLWGIALTWLHVPWPWLWALLAGALQFIPHFGPPLALCGPALAMLFTGAPMERWLGLLGAYAAIAVIDNLILQPMLMHRANRVPLWASLLVPIFLGIALPFWGVLLAAPLLAIFYAHRDHAGAKTADEREQQFSSSGNGIVLPPEKSTQADRFGRR
jgi:predicted PurR-regulated permease PerM